MDERGRPIPPLPDPELIETRQDFAHRLTEIRERAGLTVRDVAKAVGVPDSTIGGYFGGRHLPPVKTSSMLPDILAACGVTDPSLVRSWSEALNRVRRVPGRRPAGAPVPYRGLASFQPEHADWFHGREGLTATLLDHVRRQQITAGPVMVVGPSGSGKSSLLRAGLVPALRAGRLAVPGSAEWPVLVLTPGREPTRTLPVELAGLHPGARSLLVVDQAEEIFSAVPDEQDREDVLDVLQAAADGGALVVLGLRADFYPDALRHPRLARALQANQVVVGPMSEEELRRAIVEPARMARLEVEEGLVELLLRDLRPPSGNGAAHDAGALPLLSHTLLTLWSRGGRRLTIADYRQIGGIRGAVAATAESVYGDLDTAGRVLARQLFGRLVQVTGSGRATRRQVARGELPLLDPDGRATDLGEVLARFVEERLITADAEHVEITHEALLDAWPRLRAWIDADQDRLRAHRQLTEAADTWCANGRDPASLLRGGRLAAAREHLLDPAEPVRLNPTEIEFLSAATEQEQAELRGARIRTRRLRRLLAALTAALVAVGALAAVSFQQRQTATREKNLALSRQVATAANDLRTRDVSLAMQLSLVAYRTAPTPEARASLLGSFPGPAPTRLLASAGMVVQAVAPTPDGTAVLAAGADGILRFWRRTGERWRPSGDRPATRDEPTYAVAVSPDGRTAASGGGDGVVQLWNLDGPQPLARSWKIPGRATATVYSLTFSPDGETLAAARADGTIGLWEVADREHPHLLAPLSAGSPQPVQAVTFSPDGQTLAAAGADRHVRLWDLRRRTRPTPLTQPLTGGTKTIYSLAFTSDGKTLAAGNGDGTVRLWDLSDPHAPAPARTSLTGPTSWVNGLAISPDNRTVAGGSSDGKVWLWDRSTGRALLTLPHPAPVTAVAFLPDGTLTTSAADGAVRLWHLPGAVMPDAGGRVFTASFIKDDQVLVTGGSEWIGFWKITDPTKPVRIGRIPPPDNAAFTGATAVSPDGATLAAGAADGTVLLWDIRDPARPTPLPRPPRALSAMVESISFSPDGAVLAAAGDDHTARLWDLRDPRRPKPLGRPLRAQNYLYSVTFSPDGRTLAAGEAGKRVRLWDISNPSDPAPLDPLTGPTSYVFGVAFSPDGRLLAAGGGDNRIWLWDTTDVRHPRPIGEPLTGPSNYVLWVTFKPRSRHLVATSGDGTVWLWDLSDPDRPRELATLSLISGQTYTAGVDSTGSLLATGSADRTVRLWSTDPDRAARQICQLVGDPITPEEWRRHVPGLPYRPPCSS